MTRYAIYARVSTDDQDCARQVAELSAWIARRDGVLIHTSIETASAGLLTRAGRAKLIKMAQSRQIDAIAVLELSRWSRSVPDLLDTLDTLNGYGVRLCAANGPDFDTATATGRLMVTVIGAIAEFERQLIRDRTRSGLQAAKARGVKLGRQHGDCWRQRQLTSRVIEMRKETTPPSLRQMASRLSCSVNTVRKVLDTIASSKNV